MVRLFFRFLHIGHWFLKIIINNAISKFFLDFLTSYLIHFYFLGFWKFETKLPIFEEDIYVGPTMISYSSLRFMMICQDFVPSQLIDICLFHNNFKINMVFLTCILNIGHVTSKHITYSSHEINKHFFFRFWL